VNPVAGLSTVSKPSVDSRAIGGGTLSLIEHYDLNLSSGGLIFRSAQNRSISAIAAFKSSNVTVTLGEPVCAMKSTQCRSRLTHWSSGSGMTASRFDPPLYQAPPHRYTIVNPLCCLVVVASELRPQPACESLCSFPVAFVTPSAASMACRRTRTPHCRQWLGALGHLTQICQRLLGPIFCWCRLRHNTVWVCSLSFYIIPRRGFIWLLLWDALSYIAPIDDDVRVRTDLLDAVKASSAKKTGLQRFMKEQHRIPLDVLGVSRESRNE